MPPPTPVLLLNPFSMVNPEMLTTAPELIVKTVNAFAPLTAIVLAPGPEMVRDWPMLIVAAKVIGEAGGHDRPAAKVTVSPAAAPAITADNEPAPEPAQVVTVSVAALATWAGSTTTETAPSPATNAATAVRRRLPV
jgi:hypothetical protein